MFFYLLFNKMFIINRDYVYLYLYDIYQTCKCSHKNESISIEIIIESGVICSILTLPLYIFFIPVRFITLLWLS